MAVVIAGGADHNPSVAIKTTTSIEKGGEGDAALVMPPTGLNPNPTQEVGPGNMSQVLGRPSLGTGRPEAEQGEERNRPGRSSPPVRGHPVNPVNLVQNGIGPYGDDTAGAETGTLSAEFAEITITALLRS